MSRFKIKRPKYLTYKIVTIIVILIFMLPVVLLLLTSLRPRIEINTRPPIWIPEEISLNSYSALLGFGGNIQKFGFGENVPFRAYFRNSSIAATGSTILALIAGTLAAYAFSGFKFKFRNGIFLGIMLARAIPGIALGLPLLILFSKLGFTDKTLGLILIYAAMNIPFTTWLMSGFISEIPNELKEAAYIDGCSKWSVLFKLIIPLTAPGLAASGIFAFLTSWNEFAIVSVVSRTTASKTLPPGLFDFMAEFVSDWRGMCAMSILMIIPTIIFVLVVQRHLVRGLTIGAVKG